MLKTQATINDPILAKVKRIAMRIGGDNGIRSLSRAFQLIDQNGDKFLDKIEFSTGMKSYGIELTTGELDRIFSVFDKTRDGRISISEFICALRGGLSAIRMAAVNRAFNLFSKTSEGLVSLDDVRRRYDISKHPKFLNGECSMEQLENEFFSNFDEMSVDGGFVSRQDFEMYYAGFSADVESDEMFLGILNNCWRLTSVILTPLSKPVGMMTPQERAKVLALNNDKDKAQVVVAKLRAQLMKSPLGLRGLGREMRMCEKIPGEGYITKSDLHECLFKCRLDFADEDVDVLSRVHGQSELGVDLFAVMLSLEGVFPATRKVALERTWRRFPRNGKDQVPILWLQNRFNHKMMPQVVLESVTAAKMLSNFLDIWDARRCGAGGMVTYAEFEESYIHLSEVITADSHFDTMLQVTWQV